MAVVGEWDYKTPDTAIGTLLANRAYDSEKLVLSDGKQLTVAEGGAILLRYTEEGSVKHKVVTYSDVNTIKKAMNVWYDNTYLDSTGTKIQSSMIVVEATTLAASVLATVTAENVTLADETGTIMSALTFADQYGVAIDVDDLEFGTPAVTDGKATIGDGSTTKKWTISEPEVTTAGSLSATATYAAEATTSESSAEVKFTATFNNNTKLLTLTIDDEGVVHTTVSDVD